jgi:anti-anti-sigma factor
MAGRKTKQTDTDTVTTLEGALTIQQAGELKELLLRSLDGTERVTLNLEAATDIDIAGLQILCSAYRTAVTGSKSMVLAGGLPDAIKKAIEDGGFSCRSGCAAGPGTTCPWTTRRG